MGSHANYSRDVRAGEEESLSKVASKIQPGSLVLDIGCGSGMLGRFLVEQQECVVDGVDGDPVAIELARPRYRKLMVANFEHDSLLGTFDAAAYDVVVLADVLEHLINPAVLLAQIRQLVKPHGLVILSVPNITHVAVGLDLLLGKFGYRENGLLDDTHVRFFSRESLVDRLREAGIFSWEIDTVHKPLSMTEFSGHSVFPQSWVNQLVSSRQDALTYQWIVTAKLIERAGAVLELQASTSARPQLLPSAQIFWTTSFHPDFSASNMFCAEYVLDRDDAKTLSFRFDNVNASFPVKQLRVDVVNDQVGFFFLKSWLSNAQGEVVWQCFDMQPAQCVNAVLSHQNGGTLILPTNSDPQWYPAIEPGLLAQVAPGWAMHLTIMSGLPTVTRLASEAVANQRDAIVQQQGLAAQLDEAQARFDAMAEQSRGQLAALEREIATQWQLLADGQADLVQRESTWATSLAQTQALHQTSADRLALAVSEAERERQAALAFLSDHNAQIEQLNATIAQRDAQLAAQQQLVQQAHAGIATLTQQLDGTQAQLLVVASQLAQSQVRIEQVQSNADLKSLQWAQQQIELNDVQAKVLAAEDALGLKQSELVQLQETQLQIQRQTQLTLEQAQSDLAALHHALAASESMREQEGLQAQGLLAQRALEMQAQGQANAAHVEQLSRQFALDQQARADQLLGVKSRLDLESMNLKEVYASTSWRITAPLRLAGALPRKLKTAAKVARVLPTVVARSGGVWATAGRAWAAWQRGGTLALRHAMFKAVHEPGLVRPRVLRALDAASSLVPMYVDPRIDRALEDLTPKLRRLNHPVALAVHAHISCERAATAWAKCLREFEPALTVIATVAPGLDFASVRASLRQHLPKGAALHIDQSMPGQGALASLCQSSCAQLNAHEYVCHLELRASAAGGDDPRVDPSQRWTTLFGAANESTARFTHLQSLLENPDTLLFAQGVQLSTAHWEGFDAPQDHAVVFESPMFLCKSSVLQAFLDKQGEQAPASRGAPSEQQLGHLLLSMNSPLSRRNIEVCAADTCTDFLHYESQQDFSTSSRDHDVKVLAFYLPQFHPTPENDLWHGKGFTEWTNVRAANPLFEGHYQQHRVHPDLGHYSLKTVETFHKQVALMQKSGVHGQVFYHYWFGGRLILEAPAKLLLANPSVDMPYCFCWANENWTRRWDGDDADVLLAQNYSDQDARDFIRYLIAFFKDPRYITVDGRPVLQVYRPSSIPNAKAYVDIWAQECEQAGLKAPYTVAVLTRGAVSPKEFGMDAGVERVLHDWTDGAVKDIRGQLDFYDKFQGHILGYEAMSKFYMDQTGAKDFDYFRSIVPIWDNTARYGPKAYVVHGSTPRLFQNWLEACIDHARSTLPADRRFVVVNAWNEWAEGAHLEPDTRYGYSYLNAVGRALTRGEPTAPSSAVAAVDRLHLVIEPTVVASMGSCEVLSQRFLHGLRQALAALQTAAPATSVSVSDASLARTLGLSHSASPAWVCVVREPVLMNAQTLVELCSVGARRLGNAVANTYGAKALVSVTDGDGVHADLLHTAPLVLIAPVGVSKGLRRVAFAAAAQAFRFASARHAPDPGSAVTTVIRVHKSGHLRELRWALNSLQAMHDVVVQPLICAQDLSKDQLQEIRGMADEMGWHASHPVLIHEFKSQNGEGDLRSEMMNFGLRYAKTPYVALLDHDDLMLPNAYAYLIGRLKATGRAVSFGRVFATTREAATGVLVERVKSFEYGYSYDAFVGHNHAPIHSFMMDTRQIDFAGVTYFGDQKYMEDYLLTLQIFSADNATWDDLRDNVYVGDYVHNTDRDHTLALNSDESRQALVSTPAYQVCEQRILAMRDRIERNR